jgi:hypothetical protein
VTVTQQRNARFHALYWVLCSRIANAVGAEVETVSDMLKIGAGHCHVVKSKKHGILLLPKSISFAKLDETGFRTFFEACVMTIYTEWGIDRQDVLAAVNDLLLPEEAHTHA